MPDPAYTYDLATDVGRVRLLISDIPSGEPAGAVFTDAEIGAFLTLRGEVPELAAATALRSLGGNAIQVRGRLTMLDARTDAPAESKALLELADRLEAQVDAAGVVDVAAPDPVRWR